MKPVLSLDIDGVLADEDGQLVGLTAADVAQRSRLAGWYMERRPLQQLLGLDDVARWDVQIVTKREPWLEATTMCWLASAFPAVRAATRATYFLGRTGSKVGPAIRRPDVAIDDSQRNIDAYRERGVPVVAVESSRTDRAKCRAMLVQVAPDFSLALVLALAISGVIHRQAVNG